MNFSGQHQFDVDAQQLWNYLMNPEVLAKITPGVTRLETIEIDQYKSISDIKIGPVKGKFTGKLTVADKQEPQAFAIQMEQLSKIGNAHAKVNMNLSQLDTGHTQLSFEAKAKLSGVIARTGQRVLSGVANTLTKEVFQSLQQHIDEQKVIEKAASTKEVPIQNNRKTDSTQIQNKIEEPERTSAKTSAVENEHSVNQPISMVTRIINFIKKLFGIKS